MPFLRKARRAMRPVRTMGTGMVKHAGPRPSVATAESRQQPALRRMRGRPVFGREVHVAAVLAQLPGVDVVGEVVVQRLLAHAHGDLAIEDREAGFDPAQQVALQPVGAGAEQLRRPAVCLLYTSPSPRDS